MSSIKKVAVTSSFIASVEYNTEIKTMTVEMKGGKAYAYGDVPAEIVSKLIFADSVGSYYSGHIKGQYTVVRVR